MAVIGEGIREGVGGAIDFGDYSVEKKIKVENFESGGDIYRLRTHNAVTRLEKNGSMLFESVPGAAIHGFTVTERLITFCAEGMGSTQFTIELEAHTEYDIYIEDIYADKDKSNISGKISFSADLDGKAKKIRLEKVI